MEDNGELSSIDHLVLYTKSFVNFQYAKVAAFNVPLETFFHQISITGHKFSFCRRFFYLDRFFTTSSIVNGPPVFKSITSFISVCISCSSRSIVATSCSLYTPTTKSHLKASIDGVGDNTSFLYIYKYCFLPSVHAL